MSKCSPFWMNLASYLLFCLVPAPFSMIWQAYIHSFKKIPESLYSVILQMVNSMLLAFLLAASVTKEAPLNLSLIILESAIFSVTKFSSNNRLCKSISRNLGLLVQSNDSCCLCSTRATWQLMNTDLFSSLSHCKFRSYFPNSTLRQSSSLSLKSLTPNSSSMCLVMASKSASSLLVSTKGNYR